MVTRRMVAERAGVSTATVSNVIYDRKFVNPELKEKVLSVIRDLNYEPNVIAGSLATRKSKHVGIIINEMANPYFSEITMGMEARAGESGYIVSLLVTPNDITETFSSIMRRRLDGILSLATASFTRDQCDILTANNIKTVNCDFSAGGSYIIVDYLAAYREMMGLLKTLGHKSVAFISGFCADNDVEMRYRYYRQFAGELSFCTDASLVRMGGYPETPSLTLGYRYMSDILASCSDVTAVVTLNDQMAIGAMQAIRERGLSVPKDISVVGCDDIDVCRFLSPTLSTIDVPKRQMGRVAMEMLLKQIDGGAPSVVTLDTKFVRRASVAECRPFI